MAAEVDSQRWQVIPLDLPALTCFTILPTHPGGDNAAHRMFQRPLPIGKSQITSRFTGVRPDNSE
jgi:hypothetical protein